MVFQTDVVFSREFASAIWASSNYFGGLGGVEVA
jgi:hypothetical protein